MRVTRRIRPSQVGCGATIGRRRLYAASLANGEVEDAPRAARVAFVIQPDGHIHTYPLTEDREWDCAGQPELIAASASGR